MLLSVVFQIFAFSIYIHYFVNPLRSLFAARSITLSNSPLSTALLIICSVETISSLLATLTAYFPFASSSAFAP